MKSVPLPTVADVVVYEGAIGPYYDQVEDATTPQYQRTKIINRYRLSESGTLSANDIVRLVVRKAIVDLARVDLIDAQKSFLPA